MWTSCSFPRWSLQGYVKPCTRRLKGSKPSESFMCTQETKQSMKFISAQHMCGLIGPGHHAAAVALKMAIIVRICFSATSDQRSGTICNVICINCAYIRSNHISCPHSLAEAGVLGCLPLSVLTETLRAAGRLGPRAKPCTREPALQG